MTTGYIRRVIESGKISHAYILEDEDALARREWAQLFAQTLMCENQSACGTCHDCRQILARSHPDLIRVTHEKPQTLSVKEIREQICDTVENRPFANEYKVYIIDDAQLMPPGAQNALLKTLEEPPSYVIVLLLTDNAERLLETIRSRCIVIKATGETAADEEYADENVRILKEIMSGDGGISMIQEATGLIQKRGSDGAKQFLNFAELWLRDVLAWKATGGRCPLNIESAREEIRETAVSADYTRINRAIEAVRKTGERLTFNVNQELSLELLLLSL